jgi:hypothetical protein
MYFDDEWFHRMSEPVKRKRFEHIEKVPGAEISGARWVPRKSRL